eukprot:CAMPEP_0183719698 /NCGR_PEP_ID=MMETSP0737-20130205/12521_1 /TAXON_ID=385413 /ORGANISM="Thalassiosira miniscula, Strain CCMP1093" /LENGTH=741 /DNA_ID=CAMNT_0025949433 /DNA_START=250 /DNA_END=2475 /DNA_ORIENTATION=-
MDMFGDLSSGGRVLSRDELVEKRNRNGQCPTCGQKCFKKKLFKSEPITVPGKVLKGRCLVCNPQDPNKGEELVATVQIARGPPSSRSNYTSAHSVRSSSNSSSNHSSSNSSTRRARSGGLAASMPGNRMVTSVNNMVSSVNNSRHARGNASGTGGVDRNNSRGGSHRELTTIRSIPRGIRDNTPGERSEEEAAVPIRSAPSRRDVMRDGSSNGGPSGGGLARDASTRQDSFLSFQTPRPSAVFLEGINIAELFDDEDLLDDSGREDTGASASSSMQPQRPQDIGESGRSEQTTGTSASGNSAFSRLSYEERHALQRLNSSTESNYLDIVNIMLVNSMSTTVNNEGLHALSLVHDPEVGLLKECARSCGFEVIVSAMGMCSKDAMAQTNACKVLFIASASGEDLQVSIGEAGGIEALVDAMREFDDDVIVLEGCLLALSNLCIPEENLNYALEGELLELAVNAMSTNVENCGLQEHGCAVLANLAVHEQARRRIRKCGGCDTVVVSMVVNPMDVGVQSQALVALRNLCVRDEENKVALANAGALDVVIQAMQNHRDDKMMQLRGSWVLGIIGMNEDNKIYIGAHGGADVIVRSMWVHAEDQLVQEKACRALWTLSVHPRNRCAIVEVDAIPAIVEAMKNHAANPDIQERGCGTMSNLAANDDDLKIRIVKDGALDVVVMAMVLHGENEMIQDRAVALLYKLCIPENIKYMVNANVSPMMAVVAENFPECQERAAFVLTQLQV